MRVAAVCLLAAALVPRLAAQGVEARTAHFRVVTGGPAEQATAAAARLERVRADLAALGFAVPDSRTEVVLLAEPAEWQRYLPGNSAGLFQQGTDASWIAVASRPGGDPLQALAHELAHEVLAGVVGHRQPLWLREGLADLLSNLERTPEGLRMGLPIAGHAQALAQSGPLAGEPRPEDGPLYYAWSWLRVHQLVVGEPFAGTLAARIAALDPPTVAFDGIVPDPLPAEVIPVGPIAAAPAPDVRPLEAWEYEYGLADLLRAVNRTAEARVALAALRARFPGRPEPAESLGALEMDAFHYDRAAGWFARAVRLGSTNPITYYRYSQLLMRPGKDPELAERYARRAVALDPSRPLSWLAQAHAEMQLSHWDAARASLAAMRERTGDPLLVEQVRVDLAEVGRRREQESRPPPQAQPPARVTVIAAPPEPQAPKPKQVASAAGSAVAAGSASETRSRRSRRAAGWPPPGTLLFWGYVRGVECSPGQKILTVGNARFSVRVRERAGAPARLYSPPAKWKHIPCSLKGAEVNVVYRPLGGYGLINGDLVAVVF